jgi:hypothetical protein
MKPPHSWHPKNVLASASRSQIFVQIDRVLVSFEVNYIVTNPISKLPRSMTLISRTKKHDSSSGVDVTIHSVSEELREPLTIIFFSSRYYAVLSLRFKTARRRPRSYCKERSDSDMSEDILHRGFLRLFISSSL